MAFIVNYNSIHDLYVFNQSPLIDPTNYSNNQSAFPIAYNPNLYIKNPSYRLDFEVNFTGINLRGRGAPGYGFDDFINSPDVNSGGVKTTPPLGLNSYPGAVARNFLYNGNGVNSDTNSTLSCYYPGCPTGNFTKASNFNYWNNGAYATVLISPKHCIATRHFVGGLGSATFYFLGSNNVTYSKFATGIIDFSNRNTWPVGYDWPTFSYGKDMVLFELAEAFTEEELQYVKPYKILNTYGMPPNVPLFRLTPQGCVIVVKSPEYFGGIKDHLFDPTIKPGAAYQGVITSSGQIVYSTEGVGYWQGDSGSPTLCYVPRLDETCFHSLWRGGEGFYDPLENQEINQGDIILFNALKSYIYDSSGYEISLVNYSDPPPITEHVSKNGLTYSIFETTVSLNSEFVGNTSYFIGSVPTNKLFSGVTYGFVVVSYNQSGYNIQEIPEAIFFRLDPNHHPLIVIYGDENAIGLAQNYQASLNELGIKQNVKIFNNEFNIFENLNIGTTGNNILGIPGVTNVDSKFWFTVGQSGPPHGIELGIAKTQQNFSLFGNKDIHIVKMGSRGMTSGEFKRNEPNSPLDTLVQKLDFAMTEMEDSGKTPQLYFFMSIGVNDAIQGISGNTFQNNIMEVLTNLDSIVQRIDGNRSNNVGPSTPKLITLLNPGNCGANYGQNINLYNTILQNNGNSFRNAINQDDAEAIYWIKTSDAELEPNDIYHWGYTGMQLIAERFIKFSSNTWGFGTAYDRLRPHTWPLQPTY